MKFLQFLACVYLLDMQNNECNGSSTEESAATELNGFIDEFEEAAAQLKWIRETNQEVVQLRKKRNLKSDFTNVGSDKNVWRRSSFDEEDDSVDEWYSNFRKLECDDNDSIKHCNSIATPVEISKFSLHKANTPDYNSLPNTNLDYRDQIFENNKNSDLDIVNNIDRSNELTAPFLATEYTDKLNNPNLRTPNIIDQIDFAVPEQSNNYYSSFLPSSGLMNVSDVINRQALQSELNDQQNVIKNDLSDEANYKLSKIEQEVHEPNKDSPSTIPNVHKKSLTPTNEINLKISDRMMSRGLSASLPSDSNDDNNKNSRLNGRHSIIRQKRSTHNHIHSTKNSDYNQEHTPKSSERQEKLLQVGVRQSISDLNDYEESPNIDSSSEKNNPENFDENAESETEEDPNHKDSSETKEKIQENKYKAEQSGIKNLQNKQKEHKCHKGKQKQTHQRLDSKSNGIDDFKSNSITETQVKNESVSIGNLDIKLEVNINQNSSAAELAKWKLSKSNLIKREITRQDKNQKNTINDMISGQLSNEFIQAVHELVNTNEHLRNNLASSLNLAEDQQQEYPGLKKLQTHNQICVVLRPELQRFYEQIRSFNEKKSFIEEYSIGGKVKQHHSRRNRVVRSCSKNRIHESYRVINRLLDSYGKMNSNNQKLTYDVSILLRQHLQMLDELVRFVNVTNRKRTLRKVRSTIRDDYDTPNRYQQDWMDSNSGVFDKVSGKYSKLVKAAEFIRKNSLFDSTEEINDYDDYQAFDDYAYEN